MQGDFQVGLRPDMARHDTAYPLICMELHVTVRQTT
jgi:hypothetical protein